jgi:hypothetical protein
LTLSDLYSQTLAVLNNARNAMLTASFQASLTDPDDRLAASRALGDIQRAILTLANTALSDIVDEMKDNQVDLANACKGLDDALDKIENVQKFLTSITNVINVVAKIVPLL